MAWDVYLLAGQSDMVGQGDASTLTSAQRAPMPLSPMAYNVIFTGGATYDNYGYVPTQPRPAGKFGPWLPFTQAIAPTGRKIATLTYAYSETSLATQWLPSAGIIYPAMKAFFDARLAKFAATFGTYDIKGFVWYHGQEDAKTAGPAAAYGTNLGSLITQVRADYGSSLKAYVYQLYYNINPVICPYLSDVRGGQASYCGSDANSVLANIDSTPDALYTDTYIHLNNVGQYAVANVMAPFAMLTPQGP